MTVTIDNFKQALRLWASGVTVVTSKTEQSGCQGMTATSFSSVSTEPAQILVCINESADTGKGIREGGHFAVNILNNHQQDISNQFAGASSQQQRFDNVSWSEGVTGVPVLDDSLASIECKLAQQVLAGTHWIMIGEVQNVICRSGSPLLYYNSAYQSLAEPGRST